MILDTEAVDRVGKRGCASSCQAGGCAKAIRKAIKVVLGPTVAYQ